MYTKLHQAFYEVGIRLSYTLMLVENLHPVPSEMGPGCALTQEALPLQVLRAACFSVYGLAALGIGLGVLPWTCALVLVSLPMVRFCAPDVTLSRLLP